MNLNEHSLRPDVLKDLIFEIISVDEYSSKVGKDNIVVALQVMDNFDAAYDLSSFIEKSPVNVVDTEASETPNVDGRYLVFVEFERNGEFIEKLLTLIKTIENICPDPGWKLQLYGVNDPIDLDFDEISSNIELAREETISEFFDNAGVAVETNDSTLRLRSTYGDLHYQLGSGYVTESYVKELLQRGFVLDTTRLSSVLGESYDVLKSGSEYIVGHNGKYVILR